MQPKQANVVNMGKVSIKRHTVIAPFRQLTPTLTATTTSTPWFVREGVPAPLVAWQCEACDHTGGRNNPLTHSAYLGRCDVLPPFDVQQSQDVVGVGVHVVKTRGHSALLVAAQRPKFKCDKTAGRSGSKPVCFMSDVKSAFSLKQINKKEKSDGDYLLHARKLFFFAKLRRNKSNLCRSDSRPGGLLL